MRPPWPRLALRFTRTRWAGVALLPIAVALSGVARSGETFNSVAFSCIWLHCLPPGLPGLPSGVARRLAKPLIQYAVGIPSCIWLHCLPIRTLTLTLSQRARGSYRRPGMRGSPAFTGTTEGTGPTRRWRSHPWRGTILRSAQERQTFNSLPFPTISFHSRRRRRAGMRGSRLRGNDGGICGNDACDQCKGWRGDGAMGSLSLV